MVINKWRLRFEEFSCNSPPSHKFEISVYHLFEFMPYCRKALT
ncbi:hypothetical protein COLO4_33582 [Corchorus olitorius]|uniref:Uncharacterized protein n=1 Tax=Corchorus olitorius TaxID=93759 RepID=A0A1R3GSJ1_9ROSI|nr:hypothetical protein COLO4_33582 [Corchorus olitorius]